MPPLKVVITAEFRNKEEIEKGRKALEGVGATVKKISKVTEASTKKMGLNFTLIAWHFRYLGNIMDRVAKSIVRVIKDVITVASELEESFLSISVAGAIFGRDAERASELARELARTGLMPLVDAASSVKDLMITGLGLPEMEKFIYRYLDVAFLFTSGADEMTKSLKTMSKSILRGTLVLSTDVLARSLWVETEKRLQRTMGLSMKQITAQQRALELLTTIEKEHASTLGLHEMELETMRAAMTRLNFAITEIKNAFGIALLPLLHAVGDAMVKVSVYVRALLKVMGSAVPVIMAVGLAFVWLTAKISFSIGVFISVMKIAGMTAAMMWKIYLPVLAIGAVIAGVTYLYLKHSGALDRARQSAANMSAQLEKLRETMAGMAKIEEEGMGIEEDRRIAHERAVADIEEDLEREVSKGLWANQMTIKDLKKRLSRENEDWKLYLKKRGELEEGGADTTSSLFDKIFEDATGLAEDLGKIDFWAGLREKTEEIWEWLKDKKTWEEIGKKISEWLKIGIQSVTGFFDTLTEAVEKIDWFDIGKRIGKTIREGIVGFFIGLFKVLFGSDEEQRGEGKRFADNIFIGFFTAFFKFQIAWHKAWIELGLGITAGLFEEPFKKFLSWMRRELNILVRWINRILPRRIEIPIIPKFEFEKEWERGLRGFPVNMPWAQFGGIVPGMRNQPVPIMAHGGERIIPAGETAGGGNITININNPSVRNDRDINEIARQVSQAMGQRQKFSRLGSF